METIERINRAIVRLIRTIFMIKSVTISCISKDEKQNIIKLGGTINGEPFYLSKCRLIFKLKAYERCGYSVFIKIDETKIKINDNLINNLINLPNCK